MAWEHLEQRLSEIFKIQITFASGVVSLPSAAVTLDEWLTSLAQTDEELRELNIPRMRFLQNRWRVEQLLKITWENPPDLRSIWSMYVGDLAYVFMYDGIEYHVLASITPRTSDALFRAVIGELVQNRNVIPAHPAAIQIYRPDLVPEAVTQITTEGSIDFAESASKPPRKGRGSFLTELLFGWIARWMHQPEHAFWREDEVPASFSTTQRDKTAEAMLAEAGASRQQKDRTHVA